MNLTEFSQKIFELTQNEKEFLIIFLDKIDFTNPVIPKFELSTKNEKFIFNDLKIENNRFSVWVNILLGTIFKEGNIVYSWEIKPFFSFIRMYLGYDFSVKSSILDLRIFSSYLQVKLEKIDFLVCKEFIDKVPDHLLKINDDIYNPMIKTVLPAIETEGIYLKNSANKKYLNYDVEGIKLGRLRCTKLSDRFINFHTMKEEERGWICNQVDHKFLTFDYNHIEVNVLAFVSGCKILNKIIEEGKDAYEEIYKIISGSKKCGEKQRNLIKDVFLSVVYGVGKETLSKLSNLPIEATNNLYDLIVSKFNGLFVYLKGVQQEADKNGKITDHLGRVSYYEGNGYKARNAIIRGLADYICQEKLCELYFNKPNRVQLFGSLHDGYFIQAHNESFIQNSFICKDILESPSKVLPKIKLNVKVSQGEDLSNLKRINYE